MRLNTLITLILKGGSKVFCLSFLLCVVSACSMFPVPKPELAHQKGLAVRHEIEAVPLIPQEDHYCGPAAVATLAQFNGQALTQGDAAGMVYTPGRKGTFQHDIVSALQRSKMLAIPVNTTDDLLREVSADHPVMIFQNRGHSLYPIWHYSVVRGYDLNEKELLIHGGLDHAQWKSFATIGKTWRRAGYWGYVAVPVGEFVPTASVEELLQATAGLEAVGHFEEAYKSYTLILQLAPDNAFVALGLGNASMEMKEFARAEKHYRQALALDPEQGFALNNLAYSLKEQGRARDACRVLQTERRKPFFQNSPMLNDSYAELCSK